MVILLGFMSDRALSLRTATLISASGDNLFFFVVSSSPLRVDFLITGFSLPLSFLSLA
jgi:large subunit ribosomal protein L40